MKLSREGRETAAAYLFLLPNIVGFLAFTSLPVLAAFGLSFFEWDMLTPAKFVGIDNYTQVLTSPDFWHVVGNTTYYTFGVIPLEMTVALLLATALNKSMRGLVVYRTGYFLPVVSSWVAVAIVWRWVYNPDFGLLNYALSLIGIQGPNWLGDMFWAMPAVIIVSAWKHVGYNMILYLAGLQGIPQHLYEAAAIDGATTSQQFRHLTLPLLTPTTFFIVIIGIIRSYQVFSQVYIMTEGGPAEATRVWVYHLYEVAFQSFRMGEATTLAWLLFAVIFVFTVVQWGLQKKWVHYDY